jgi:hypothetical protein
MLFHAVKIRALSVFEGIVYHCHAVDTANPCRPTLEVDAVTREGDLDQGPLLVTVADYARMARTDSIAHCLDELRSRGRLVEHMGVLHVAFPTWTFAEEEAS